MALIPPQLKLAFMFANIVRDYGPILLHLNKPELLTKDLGDAMREQKRVLSDPGKGVIMTASEVFPVILKVKVLSTILASKLGIDKSKSAIETLEEIVRVSEENGNGQFSKGIKETLGWTRALFADPDIQVVLKMPMTEIESPDLTVSGVGKFLMSLASRSQDEFIRVQEFLKAAKEIREEPPVAPAPSTDKEPTATAPSTPANDAAATPASEDATEKKPHHGKKHKPAGPAA